MKRRLNFFAQFVSTEPILVKEVEKYFKGSHILNKYYGKMLQQIAKWHL